MTQPFDFIVIGAGSGGTSAALQASRLGAKVLIIEQQDLGGTCVNVGCVPKKIMWYASQLAEGIERAHSYGFDSNLPHLHWPTLIQQRQTYIERIHKSYRAAFKRHDIPCISGSARFISPHEIGVEDQVFQAPHILIATGGTPTLPQWPGASLGMTSEGFFELESCPKKTAIVGGGYIAVELAGILQSLGSKVHLCIRHDKPLRHMDSMISEAVNDYLLQQGVELHTHFEVEQLEKQPNGQLRLSSLDDKVIQDCDAALWAIGRKPNLESLNLEAIGLQTNAQGFIECDDQYLTSIKGIYAVGDVIALPHLTPVAIRCGKRLACLLFGGENLEFNSKLVPSVIFSHPPVGTIGFTEQEAKARFGESSIQVYKSEFKPMFEALMDVPRAFKIKMITQGKEERVVGLHIAGLGSDEILQGFAAAMQAGATKKDFSDTIAIHPTSSEEIVLIR